MKKILLNSLILALVLILAGFSHSEEETFFEDKGIYIRPIIDTDSSNHYIVGLDTNENVQWSFLAPFQTSWHYSFGDAINFHEDYFNIGSMQGGTFYQQETSLYMTFDELFDYLEEIGEEQHIDDLKMTDAYLHDSTMTIAPSLNFDYDGNLLDVFVFSKGHLLGGESYDNSDQHNLPFPRKANTYISKIYNERFTYASINEDEDEFYLTTHYVENYNFNEAELIYKKNIYDDLVALVEDSELEHNIFETSNFLNSETEDAQSNATVFNNQLLVMNNDELLMIDLDTYELDYKFLGNQLEVNNLQDLWNVAEGRWHKINDNTIAFAVSGSHDDDRLSEDSSIYIFDENLNLINEFSNIALDLTEDHFNEFAFSEDDEYSEELLNERLDFKSIMMNENYIYIKFFDWWYWEDHGFIRLDYEGNIDKFAVKGTIYGSEPRWGLDPDWNTMYLLPGDKVMLNEWDASEGNTRVFDGNDDFNEVNVISWEDQLDASLTTGEFEELHLSTFFNQYYEDDYHYEGVIYIEDEEDEEDEEEDEEDKEEDEAGIPIMETDYPPIVQQLINLIPVLYSIVIIAGAYGYVKNTPPKEPMGPRLVHAFVGIIVGLSIIPIIVLIT